MARPTWAQRNGIAANAWREVRARVLSRARYLCEIRDPGCEGHAVEVDHVVPPRFGGAKYDMANLRAACRACNGRRGARLGNRVRDANTFQRGYAQALRDHGLA
jgi:5-methylcytosine-specific restriction endonuclease McrA